MMELLTDEIKQKMPGPMTTADQLDPTAYAKFVMDAPNGRWTWYVWELWHETNVGEEGVGERALSEQLAENESIVRTIGYAKVVTPIVPDGELGTFCLDEIAEHGAWRDDSFEPKPVSQCESLHAAD